MTVDVCCVLCQVFRHCDAEQNVFTLIGQTVFDVKEDGLGELMIDISSQPLSVQAGDVIGFHVVDRAVIPYDEDESRMTTLYCQSLDDVEAPGRPTITMDSNLELARTYSLLANIVVSRELS